MSSSNCYQWSSDQTNYSYKICPNPSYSDNSITAEQVKALKCPLMGPDNAVVNANPAFVLYEAEVGMLACATQDQVSGYPIVKVFNDQSQNSSTNAVQCYQSIYQRNDSSGLSQNFRPSSNDNVCQTVDNGTGLDGNTYPPGVDNQGSSDGWSN